MPLSNLCREATEDNSNDEINSFFTNEEISDALKKLKNNKASGLDMMKNEFLKSSGRKMIPLFTKLFNLILYSEMTPDEWVTGIIKPIFKHKGSQSDPNNYRGITILSCFGKLFTSVINNRLNKFFNNHNTIGPEQAGFRAGHSALDHVFTLHCLIDLYLAKRKRLFCLFVDYEKAFDRINRAFLWQKLINSGVKGRILSTIKNMYEKAKSCVNVNDEYTDYFEYTCGVRQGENLSPLLFAIYLNDLHSFISSSVQGLPLLAKEIDNAKDDNADEELMLKLFILLYADDTVICSESAEGLQVALDAMSTYCEKWSLQINSNKTKVMVFSRGKIKKLPKLKYRNENLEVVFGFQYLGIWFNYNNKFSITQKKQYDRASRAMFSLIKKCKKLFLPMDVQIELFDRMIVPILLYGCEVWCPSMINVSSQLQLRFYKILFKLNNSTPNCMVYGESGQFPVTIQAKVRMLTFWYNLVNSDINDKLSCTFYRFLHRNYVKHDGYTSPYLSFVQNTLNDIGLSGLWDSQFRSNLSANCFKDKIKRRLKDQFIQGWLSEVNTKESCYNYRLYKTTFQLEKYIEILPQRLIYPLIRFRTLNHRLPIQKGRWSNIPRNERKCTLCCQSDLGDEFHYVLVCPFFNDRRKHYLPVKYWKHPNVIKFQSLFCNTNYTLLSKLTYFVKDIMNEFKR